MKMLILKPKKTDRMESFINHWSEIYSYQNREFYTNNIDKETFHRSHIESLFVWKNGMKLSKKKAASLKNKILSKLNRINKFKKDKQIDLAAFCLEFKDVPSVWKIFLLHIIKPKVFPIYDQHIHRAYNYINGEDWKGVSNKMSKKEKESFYFDTYLSFVEQEKITDLKKFDEAMFSFGQFLNTRNYSKLLQ